MQDFISLIIYLIGIVFLLGFFAIIAISMWRVVKSLLNNPDAFKDIWNDKKSNNNSQYTDYEDLK
jgi:hypothetical protein